MAQASTCLTPKMKGLQLDEEGDIKPHPHWNKHQQDELLKLGEYHTKMIDFCRKLWVEGPASTEDAPLNPKIFIEQFLTAQSVRQPESIEQPLRCVRESEESLEELSNYLKAKIREEAEVVGWRPDMNCDDIDQLIKHIKQGHQFIESQKRALFQHTLDLGTYLERLFILSQTDKRYGSWKSVLQEKCNISVSYAGKLRSMAVLLEDYPKFKKLAISFYEMQTRKPRIKQMLAVSTLAEFWKSS